MSLPDSSHTLTENKWLQELYVYCSYLFRNTHLPSHNQDHHYRVWHFSKLLVSWSYPAGNLSQAFVDNLIFAAFFHDTGMIKTTSREHGVQSRDLLIDFLSKKKYFIEDFLDAIVAVEKHDRKVYSSSKSSPDRLQAVLCAADDLDAFGHIGIARYLEIYHLRGLDLGQMPRIILPDLEERLTFLEKNFAHAQPVVRKQKERYLVCRNFFNELANSDPSSVNFLCRKGVLDTIIHKVLIAKNSYEQGFRAVLESSPDLYLSQFARSVLTELDELKFGKTTGKTAT